MGFIEDFKKAWKEGKIEARNQVVAEFFAYLYGVKYRDAIINKSWIPAQYQDIFDVCMNNGNTVRIREDKELLLDMLEYLEFVLHNKIDMTKADGYVHTIVNTVYKV